ncbi:MAG: mechanosensitive ion channel family protein [Cyanobacteria bacterium P01_F01_bin.150]
MINAATEQIQYTWAFVLITIFPLCSIGLGEIISRLRYRNHPITNMLQGVRMFVLPPLAVLLVTLKLLHVPADGITIQVIATILGLAAMYSAITLINAILVSDSRHQYAWQVSVPNLLFQVTRSGVVLCVAYYLLAITWQIDLSKLFAALGVGSLVIALALQDTLSNLVSGFLLIFEAPFQVGDWIRVQDVQGEVLEVNWRAVRLKTPDHDVVIIPNGVLGKETINNYTLLYPLHGDRTTFTFSNEEAPNKVISVLKTAALEVEGILADPAPKVRPLKFTDHQAEYEVQYCISDFTNAEIIQGQFVTNVYYATKRHQLTLPMPMEQHYVLQQYPQKGQDSTPDISNALAALPIFRELDEAVLDTLVQKAEIKYYGVGETVIKAGELDRAIYILLQGQVMLSSSSHKNDSYVITTLDAGALFGEMALLRNEASLVTVKVLQDVKLAALGGDALFSIAQQHANFALEMEQFINERKKMVKRVMDQPVIDSKGTNDW